LLFAGRAEEGVLDRLYARVDAGDRGLRCVPTRERLTCVLVPGDKRIRTIV
jgi:hypothetical protein